MLKILYRQFIIASLLASINQICYSKNGIQVVKISLLELKIIDQLMQQVDLNVDELETFTLIEKPIEDLLFQNKDTNDDKIIQLSLTTAEIESLLSFLNRLNIKGGAAKQLYQLILKLQKPLPKESPLKENDIKEKKDIPLALNIQEVILIDQLLNRIEVYTPEIKAFLYITDQLKNELKGLNQESDLEKVVTINLNKQALNNFIIFLQRVNLIGAQVKPLYSIINRIMDLKREPNPSTTTMNANSTPK